MNGDTTRRGGEVIPLPGPPDALERVGGYRLLRLLGRGGMGAVYLAESLALRRLVALKLLTGIGDPEAVERFLIEARAAARLKHPNVVGVHEVGRDGPRWFLAMDLVDGESLRARIVREGPLEPREAARIVWAIGLALHHAHSHGVLHRDLKPHNILLAKEGTPLLADFGLAKDVAAAGITVSGDVLGTPAYMPPEQAQGERARVDRRADVYSLGATLYEALTGRPPFEGATAINVLRQVVEDPPVPPSRRRPGLDRDLEVIVLKALEKEPSDRYDTAAELAEDLRRWSADEPISARRPGAGDRAARWARRHTAAARALAGSTVVAALALSALVGAEVSARARDASARDRARGAFERAWHDLSQRGADPTTRRAVFKAERAAFELAEAWIALAAHEPDARAAFAASAVRYAHHARWEGQWLEAERAYESAARLADDAAGARLAEWCRRAAELESTYSRDPPVGRRRAELLVKDFPDVGQSWQLRAVKREGYDEGAAADALRATQLEPSNPASWKALAQVYRGDDAAQVLARGVEQCPDWTEGWVDIAVACLRLDRPTQALEAAERAVAQEPANAFPHLVRAAVHMALGDSSARIADLERARDRSRDDPTSWWRLAMAHLERGDATAASAAMDELVATAPGDAAAWHTRARLRLRTSDCAGALADCDRAAALDGEEDGLVASRGLALLGLGRLEEALEEAERALRMNPLEPTALACRGIARVRSGQTAAGRADLERFLALAPDHFLAGPARALLSEGTTGR